MSIMQEPTTVEDTILLQKTTNKWIFSGLIQSALMIGLFFTATSCASANVPAIESPNPVTNELRTTQTAMPTTTSIPILAPSVTATQPVLAEAAPMPSAPIAQMTVVRPAPGENRYFISGPTLSNYAVGDLLAVYAKDLSGLEFDAAVVAVIDSNEDNLIVQVIFRNADAPIGSLSALRLDDQLDAVNLAQMMPASSAFVGFMLDNGTIRLIPNAKVKKGDELEAVQLTAGGDALPFSNGPVLVQIESVGVNGTIARVAAATEMPPLGALLVFNGPVAPSFILVNGYTQRNDICVDAGDTVTISASNEIKSDLLIGFIPPAGKTVFTASDVGLGLEQVGIEVEAPIDANTWNKIPQFPHGALLYRIEGESDWRGYHAAKQFVAPRAGCLEFDVNIKDTSQTSGAFDVQVDVQP